MADNATLTEKEELYIFSTYRRYPVHFVRGSLCSLWDTEGKEYLDMISGLGTAGLGHCPQVVVDAVREQVGKLIHTSNLYFTEPQIELAEKLSRLSLGGKCFFANSGAEANEAAIKLARRHGKINRGGAYKIVTAMSSFHGRTLATLAATGQPAKHEPFQPVPEGFTHVDFNDIGALEKAVGDDVCAVFLEPVQGEGGVWPAREDYLRMAAGLCRDKGVLLMFDEVQTGLGRCGEIFAYQRYGVEPDVLTTAKALANGLPIGAMVAKRDHSQLLAAGDHATTYGGGPVVCAAALAVLDAIEKDRLYERAREKGELLAAGLDQLAAKHRDKAEGSRGLGLMLALQLKQPIAREVVLKCLEKGVLVNDAQPDAIRFLPPLVIQDSQIEKGLSVLDKALGEVS